DRNLSLSVGEQLLVAAPVRHDRRGRSRDSAVPALVYDSVLSTCALGSNPRTGATRCKRASVERSLAHLDPTGALAVDGWTASFSAQSRPQWCDRNTERSLASRLQMEWRVCTGDDQHSRADDCLLAPGVRRDQVAV